MSLLILIFPLLSAKVKGHVPNTHCLTMCHTKISPNFRVFTSQVSCMEIPKSVQDALKIPEWKEVVFEEMKALEKTRHRR